MRTRLRPGLRRAPFETVWLLLTQNDQRFLACALQVKAGLGVNVIGLVIVMVAINTWGVSLFHLDTFPAWAKVGNITDQT